jgi:hypothetical protein
MKVKEVQATFSFTKNLGNYQSLRVEAGAVAELEPGEKPEKVIKEIFKISKAQVDEQVAEEKHRR